MTPAGFYFDPQTVTDLKDSGSQRQTLERVAQQFEALFVHMLLKQMREASFGDSNFDSSQSTFYRDMFDAQMAQHVGGQAGLGIAEMLVRELGAAMPAAPEEAQSEISRAILTAPKLVSAAPPPSPPVDSHLTNGAPAQHIPPVAASVDTDVAEAARERPRDEQPDVPAHWRIFTQASRHPEVSPPGVARSAAVGEPDLSGGAEDWQSPREFLAHLHPFAKQVEKDLGVPSNVLLAQATLETGWGRKLPRHPDGRNSFNLFGIKADGRWSGESVSKPTLEFAQGSMRREHAQFRAYASPDESFQDYTSFLQESPRYANALSVASDPAAYLHALQSAGYATDPNYAQKVLSLVDSERFRSALPDAGAKESSDGAV